LDIGCAKGFLVKAFRDLGIEAWGVDVSEYALSSAPDDIRPNLHKVDLNREPLPFEDQYFDFITFLGTIEYLDDHKHILREISRVLRDAGGLYLNTLSRKDPKDKFRINIHDKYYWIREFQSNGLRVVPEKLSVFLKARDNA